MGPSVLRHKNIWAEKGCITLFGLGGDYGDEYYIDKKERCQFMSYNQYQQGYQGVGLPPIG